MRKKYGVIIKMADGKTRTMEVEGENIASARIWAKQFLKAGEEILSVIEAVGSN